MYVIKKKWYVWKIPIKLKNYINVIEKVHFKQVQQWRQ